MKKHNAILVISLLLVLTTTCVTTETSGGSAYLWNGREGEIAASGIEGFGIFYHIPGQWNGPVTSDTPAGDFPAWYVDSRPVSPSQISEFSIADSTLCNYLTFFVVKHEGQLKVAMRTDARFMDQGCVTYEVLQEADEAQGYYKFADFQSGDSRAYTIFEFSGNRMEMRVYTNKFNTLKEPGLHSVWKARRITMESSFPAIEHFNYPQPVMVTDFTDTFGNIHEAVYFEVDEAPFRSENEPYVGSITFNITIDDSLETSPSDELFIMLTTEPIFKGVRYDPDRLNYISKFVYLPISEKQYTMTHVHPGTYYLYSYNDINGDKFHKRGDYMSSRFEHIIDVIPEKNITVHTHIDFVIP